MASTEFILNVASSRFDQEVVERSREVPVLVDFWAEWCGPCRALGPVLEKVANDSKGSFVLAKVDTEANQDLAAKFNIRGIPAVKLFVDGNVVGEFVGALPEQAVREFIRKHCPTQADKLAKEAKELVASARLDEATEKLRSALKENPEHPGAHLEMARIALTEGKEGEVEEHLAAIPPGADEADVAQILREALQFLTESRNAGGETNCRKRLESNPDDIDARYGLGACLAARGEYREALDEFLAVVTKDKRYRDEAARKAMLVVFGILGVRSELSDEYRRKLSMVL